MIDDSRSAPSRETPDAAADRCLAARGLRKRYARSEVLRGVDLDVRAGEICFLLGINGAGKSTLLGCLAGEVAFDAGAVQVRVGAERVDLMAQPDRARRGLVALPQRPPLAPMLSPNEHFEAMSALRSLPAEAAGRFAAHAAALGISAFLDAPCRTLSGGTQQKVGLALAVAVEAPLLLLDEPWTGLDILSARALRQLLESERRRGAALLVASHLPETAVQLADRCLVLAGGRISCELDAAEMRSFAGDPARFEAAVIAAMGRDAASGSGYPAP